jgi:hypothetical protein
MATFLRPMVVFLKPPILSSQRTVPGGRTSRNPNPATARWAREHTTHDAHPGALLRPGPTTTTDDDLRPRQGSSRTTRTRGRPSTTRTRTRDDSTPWRAALSPPPLGSSLPSPSPSGLPLPIPSGRWLGQVRRRPSPSPRPGFSTLMNHLQRPLPSPRLGKPSPLYQAALGSGAPPSAALLGFDVRRSTPKKTRRRLPPCGRPPSFSRTGTATCALCPTPGAPTPRALCCCVRPLGRTSGLEAGGALARQGQVQRPRCSPPPLSTLAAAGQQPLSFFSLFLAQCTPPLSLQGHDAQLASCALHTGRCMRPNRLESAASQAPLTQHLHFGHWQNIAGRTGRGWRVVA